MKSSSELDQAVKKMLAACSDNEWFLRQHWPVHGPRIRLIASDLMERFPQRGASLLDLGCFNGYFSLMATNLGFHATGCDAYKLPELERLFAASYIDFLQANLNQTNVFSSTASNTFDAVVMGEILEHILNHPVGLLQEIARITKPGGLLFLTTPNPSNIMNAARVILDRHTLWGTDKFASLPKMDRAGVICEADIHYREYRASELAQMISESGFRTVSMKFIPFGHAPGEGGIKTLLKRTPGLKTLMTRRVFASTHYLVAEKP
jgi:2-polyprenyl-3-methyl-5-hydroxy-6-metoxy-1,4-benzoquinol methylase